MGHALHTWTWASALTGVQFLLTSTAAPTSSALSLFKPSNSLDRFPCIPALSHASKPANFPVSNLCPKPTNATLQNDRVDGFWAWPPFALFSMENYPPKVHTLTPPRSLSKRLNEPARSSIPYSRKLTTTPQSTNGGGTSPPPTTRPPLKKTTSPFSKNGLRRPSTLPSNRPSSARRSKTSRNGCRTCPRA